MLIINPENGQIIFCNNSAVEFYGLSREELCNKHIQDLNILSEEEVHNEMEMAKSEDRLFFRFKHELASGEIRDVDVYSSPVKIGNDIYLYSIIHDITELLAIEEENEQLRQDSFKRIGILAGGIAHDFNNILTTILGNLELFNLLNLDLTQESKSILADINDAVLKAKNLSSELITFSKGNEPVKKVHDISEIVSKSTSFTLRGSSIICNTEIIGRDFFAYVNSMQISRVLNNIILNAKQVMHDHGKITCRVFKEIITKDEELPDGSYIIIEISDDGPGIKEEDQKHIFSPYFTTKTKGRGLGLATAYSVMQRHGGKISFTTTIGKGTTFSIFLPIATSSPTPDIRKEFQLSHFTGDVVVLDDEEGIHKTLTRMLEVLGLNEIAFYRSKSLIAWLEENPSQAFAIILDLTLPGDLGGEQIIDLVKNKCPETPIIVSSGYSDNSLLANYQEYGFDASLPKPYTIDELQDVLTMVKTK